MNVSQLALIHLYPSPRLRLPAPFCGIRYFLISESMFLAVTISVRGRSPDTPRILLKQRSVGTAFFYNSPAPVHHYF